MPTFNNGEKLHRTISSVLNQTMKSTDYELILLMIIQMTMVRL